MLKKIVLVVLFAGLLSACGRGHDGGNFAYIGCHVVTENPHCMPGKDKCTYAFGPGDLKPGDKIYFKQFKLLVLVEMMTKSLLQAVIVLVPTYITAYLTDKMIYVIPMLAAASFVAASLSPSNLNRRVEEDGYKKDDGSN